MTRSSPYTRSMVGGIVSSSLVGRIDDANRESGLAECRNMIVLPEGIGTSRPGTRYVRGAKNNDRKARMIPFRYSSTQTVALEFGHTYIRFHTYGASLVTPTATAWSAVPTYSAGDLVSYGGFVWSAVYDVPANKQPDLFEYGSGVVVVSSSWVETYPRSTTAPVGYDFAGTELPAIAPIGDQVYLLDYEITYETVEGGGGYGGLDGIGPGITIIVTTYYTGYTGTAGASAPSDYWYNVGAVGSVYEIPSPYDETHIPDLHYVQSGDVLTITHPLYAPRELRRHSATNWSLDVIDFGSTLAAPTISSVTPVTASTPSDLQDYSYVATNVSDDQLDESVASAAVTASNQLFDTGAKNTITFGTAGRRNVYRLVGGLYGFIGQTVTTTLIDDNIAPDISQTPPNSQDPFAADWPGAVSYFGQRRGFAGTPLLSQSFWLTKAGTESNLDYSIPVRADDAISVKIAAREASVIRHLVPLGDLIILTSSGAFSVSSDGPLTQATARRSPTTGYVGASNVQPVVVVDDLIYAAARGGHLYGLGFNFGRQRYIPVDISVRAPHLFDFKTIKDMAYTHAPTPIVWSVSSDGSLVALTYVPNEEVKAFHQHMTLGSFESICAVAEGDEDIIYAIVKRTIGGATVRYVECFSPRFYATASDAFFVDAGLTYNGTAATVISGLDHLEGETVNILADAAVVPAQVVTGGQITLDTAASVVQVGLPMARLLQTLPIAVDNVESYGQGVEKTLCNLNVRVAGSGAWFAGSDLDNMRETPARSTETWGSPANLTTGFVDINIDDSWNQEGQVYILATDPTPLTVLSFTQVVEFGG